MQSFIVSILVAGSICASTGTVLLKIGATGRSSLISFFNVWIFLGLFLYGLGATFWIYGMSKKNLIEVYPFTVLSFVIVYAAGIFFLGEAPSKSGLAGILFVLVGLYLVGRASPG